MSNREWIETKQECDVGEDSQVIVKSVTQDLSKKKYFMASNNKTFDVFFSYSHVDKKSVEVIANRVDSYEKISIWLDTWELVPGDVFRNALSHGLEQAKSCAVFIGNNIPSGWFDEEINKAINLQTKDKDFRVIPVLLPGAQTDKVSGFLESRSCVDFKGGLDDVEALQRLVSGIKGVPPGKFKLSKKVKDPNKVNVEITLSAEFRKYGKSQQQELLGAIEKLLVIGSSLVIKTARKGSVVLTIELDKELAQKLIEAEKNGFFNNFNIKSLRIVNETYSENAENSLRSRVIDIIDSPIIIQELNSSGVEARNAERRLYEQYFYLVKKGMGTYHLSEEESANVYSDSILSVIYSIKNGFKTDWLLKDYIRLVFKNKAIKAIQKSKKVKQHVDTWQLTDDVETAIDELILTRGGIGEKLDHMPEECRQLLLLLQEGCTDKEIAEKMDYESAAVAKTARLRCFQKLREVYFREYYLSVKQKRQQ